METLTLIISSGVVSGLISVIAIFMLVGSYKQKVDDNTKNIDKLSDRLVDLSDRISKLEGGIDRDRAYIRSKSPLSLTDKGKAVLLDSTGKDFVDRNQVKLINEIRIKHPKTAYDVQELAQKVVELRTNGDDFNSIKDYAFDKGMKLETIVNILGIYLRDIALAELGFNISDIKD